MLRIRMLQKMKHNTRIAQGIVSVSEILFLFIYLFIKRRCFLVNVMLMVQNGSKSFIL